MKLKSSEPYRFLFIMDPYATLNLDTETSLLLMDELISLGHAVFWTESSQLVLRQNSVCGFTQQVQSVDPFQLLKEQEEVLDGFDVVLMRNDPPFDINYLHLTYILDFLSPNVIQFNPVRSVRNANEKLFALNWPELVPPTITTMNHQVLARFLEEHKKIVIKPIEDCSGRGIKFLDVTQSDVEKHLMETMVDSQGKKRFITAQKFLKQVADGDKRVYLVNGKPLGIVNRLPPAGSYLANIHQGAQCIASKLSLKERQIVHTIAPLLAEKGLFLVGLDMIGEYITEINLTSPSAVRQINQVMGKQLEKEIVSAMLEYIRNYQNKRLTMEYL